MFHFSYQLNCPFFFCGRSSFAIRILIFQNQAESFAFTRQQHYLYVQFSHLRLYYPQRTFLFQNLHQLSFYWLPRVFCITPHVLSGQLKRYISQGLALVFDELLDLYLLLLELSCQLFSFFPFLLEVGLNGGNLILNMERNILKLSRAESSAFISAIPQLLGLVLVQPRSYIIIIKYNFLCGNCQYQHKFSDFFPYQCHKTFLLLSIFILIIKNIKRMTDSENNPQIEINKHRVDDQAISKSQQKENKNEQQQMNYYNQFCRLYLTNTILTAQLKELNMQKNQLLNKLNRIQKRAEELSQGNSGQADEKKRRVRRSASEIARHYKCQVEGCNKSYGSEGSLNQHLKIKHPQIFRTLGAYTLSNNPPVQQSSDEDQSR